MYLLLFFTLGTDTHGDSSLLLLLLLLPPPSSPSSTSQLSFSSLLWETGGGGGEARRKKPTKGGGGRETHIFEMSGINNWEEGATWGLTKVFFSFSDCRDC